MEGNVKLMKPKTLHLPLFHCGVHLPFPGKYQSNQEISVNGTSYQQTDQYKKGQRDSPPLASAVTTSCSCCCLSSKALLLALVSHESAPINHSYHRIRNCE